MIIADHNKISRLLLNLTEAKAEEKRQAAALVTADAALKAQQETWRQANEALNVHQSALDTYLRDSTTEAAKRIVGEPESGE